jgi:drug/metabolite transporter (DMT)-like permease
MNSNARPLDALAAGVAVVLCLSWGFNQVATKLAIAEIPPLIQATVRSAGALLPLLIWARWRRINFTLRDGTLGPGIFAGLLFGLEFLLIYRGLLWTTASRAIVFLYTAPFFVALGAGPMLGERLSALQWTGLALSFAGVAAAIGVPEASADAKMLVGDLMLIGGGATWAATTLVIKQSSLAKISAEQTLAYQLFVSAPLLGLAAWLFGERMNAAPGAVALGSLAYQTFWIVAVTYAGWFALIKRYSASRLSSFTFLTPLFGVAAGHLVLGEPISLTFAGAVALVVAGLALVNRPR